MDMCTKPEHYCLQWNNYTTHITDLFVQLLDTNCLVDVVLCVEHKTIVAHRIILSACSTFFQEIFASAEDQHPIVILGDMKYNDVKAVIEFIYRGELSVSAEQVSSVLQVARELKVRGLMEVSGQVLDFDVAAPTPCSVIEDDCEDSADIQRDDFDEMEGEEGLESNIVDYLIEDSETVEELVGAKTSKLELTLAEENNFLDSVDEGEKIIKQRRDASKKGYSEVIMNEALDDIRSGRSLQEIAKFHKIPRSTLYFRARSQGVPMCSSRHGYSQEEINTALLAVRDGCSLQQAAQQFKIPKTVLWRQIQKGGPEFKSMLHNRSKPRYDAVKKQAAIEAIENGGSISKVSCQYMIPKTTLFNEKTRLIEAGRLPVTSIRKRNQSGDGFKTQRLAEAVAACKGGRMSQAAASQAFKVSKTTIWRRLRSGTEEPKDSNSMNKEVDCEFTEPIETEEIQETKYDDMMVRLPSVSEYSIVVGDSSDVPVTYMDESDFADESLIILASGSDEPISLPVEESQIIVDSDGNQVL